MSGSIKARIRLLPEATNSYQPYQTDDSRDTASTRAETGATSRPSQLPSLLSVASTIVLRLPNYLIPDPCDVRDEGEC